MNIVLLTSVVAVLPWWLKLMSLVVGGVVVILANARYENLIERQELARRARRRNASTRCQWHAGCDHDRSVGDPYCPGHCALVCGRKAIA